ncbi:unnamed protein product, partial [Callosobruchus maculatus]
MSSIVEIIAGERMNPTDDTTETLMVNVTLGIINNVSFQCYFKFNCNVYCNFLTLVMSKIRSLTNLKVFLKKIPLKYISSEDGFVAAFLKDTIHGLINCVKTFKDEDLFALASIIIQKCLFYNNWQPFKAFVDQFFMESEINEQNVAHTMLKYLICGYEKHNIETVTIQYKLIFQTFCTAYEHDCDLKLKFLIILTHVIGLNPGKIIPYKNSNLQVDQCRLSVKKSQMIFFELLNTNNLGFDPNFKITETHLKSFLENIVGEILSTKDMSEVSYKIIKTCIDIDPSIINHLIDEIIISTMKYGGTFHQTSVDASRHPAYSLDNSITTKYLIHTNIEKWNHINMSLFEQEYDLLITIFDIYSKLNGIESLLSKIVEQFCNWCTEKPNVTENHNTKDLTSLNNTLAKAILTKFNHCVETMASWQIINVFKVLFHAMKEVVELTETYENGDSKFYMYVGLLSELLCTFISSIRVAEHTVSSHTMKKTVEALKKLQELLKNFAKRLLSKEHDPHLMRSFLNIAYHWGEIYLMVAYYSSFEYCQLNPPAVPDATACNLTFLHSYLDAQEWCLILERITNFGETPCKTLVHKLSVQKLQAMYLLKDTVTKDAKHDIITSISPHIEDNWVYILSNKFIMNNLLPEMNNQTVIGLSEICVHDFKERLVFWTGGKNLIEKPAVEFFYCSCSQLLLNSISYVCISKINKILLKYHNRQDDNSTNTFMSSKMSAILDEDIFLNRESRKSTDANLKEVLDILNEIYSKGIGENMKRRKEVCANKKYESRILNLLEIFKHFPAMQCNSKLHQIYFMYFSALHHDFQKNIPVTDERLKQNLEMILVGILQHCKLSLTDGVQVNTYLFEILSTFSNWEETFIIAVENIFKNETAIKYAEDFISKLCDNLLDSEHMTCAAIILNVLVKLKKNKTSIDTRIVANKYKQEICSAVLKLIEENNCVTEPLLIGYAHVLKHVVPVEARPENNAMINSLEKYLQKYLDYALTTIDFQKFLNKETQDLHSMSHLILFTTVLQNISKFSIVTKEDTILKIWEAIKDMYNYCSEFEEYGFLSVMIFTHIPNDQFTLITTYLMDSLDMYIEKKNYVSLSRQLHIWEYLICNLNAVKTKICMTAFEYLVLKVTSLFSVKVYDEQLLTSIYNFEKTLIQTNHVSIICDVC